MKFGVSAEGKFGVRAGYSPWGFRGVLPGGRLASRCAGRIQEIPRVIYGEFAAKLAPRAGKSQVLDSLLSRIMAHKSILYGIGLKKPTYGIPPHRSLGTAIPAAREIGPARGGNRRHRPPYSERNKSQPNPPPRSPGKAMIEARGRGVEFSK